MTSTDEVDLLGDVLKDQSLNDPDAEQEADYNDAKKTVKRLISAITINDEPDLEYDDEIGSLVAEQLEDDEIDDEYNLEDQKLGNGQFTPESLIDEDFEAELGTQAALPPIVMETETDARMTALRERIDRFGIVKVCGSDPMGRHVIVVSACKLPHGSEILEKEKEYFNSHQHFFEVLLEVISKTLERYVESEYTIVYFHYGLQSGNKPSLPWIGKLNRILDRKYKKNLKALYIIHPTYLVKILWQFLRPIISTKFHKKMIYCNSLNDLANHLDLKDLAIPDEVIRYDASLSEKKKSPSPAPASVVTYGKFQQFKVPLEYIAERNNGDCIPLVVKETIIYLRQHLDEEGLFRKSGSYERIKQIQNLYNQGEPVAYDQFECHVAASVLKAFLRELPESLLPDAIFNEIMSLQALDVTDKVEVARDLLKAKLSKYNYILLKEIIQFLDEVVQHSAQNKMDAKNLSYVFGPNFLRLQVGLMDVERINSFVELLIRFHAEVFSTID